jgi:hypothetical protein
MKMHRSSIAITNPFLTCLRQEKHVATFMELSALAVVRLLKLCTSMDREFEKSVADILREIPSESLKASSMSLQSVAVVLIGMIDGFWIQYLIAPNRLKPKDAILAFLAYLSSFFPGFKETMHL